MKLLSILFAGLTLTATVQAAPGLRAGVTFGATYSKFSSTSLSNYSSAGGVGFPLLGVNVVANFARFGLRSYLESQRYLTTYNYGSSYYGYSATAQSDFVSFVTLPSFYFGAFYVGAGGGWGYIRTGNYRTTVPWLAFGLGVEINKYLFIELRPQFDMTQTSMFSSMFMPLTIGIQFYDAPK